MAVEIKIPTIDGLTLNTKNKRVKDDIAITIGIPTYDGTVTGDFEIELDKFIMETPTEFSNSRVTIIKNGFCNNQDLATINFPNVVELGDRAFSGCAKLENIYLPKLKKIGSYGLHSTRINANNSVFETIEEMIGTNQFYAITTKGEITMPNITNVPDACFASCSGITKFTGHNVTNLGRQSFHSTSSIVTIDCPNVETLGNQVFQSSGIQYISLNKVKEVGTQMFNSATRLEIAEFDSLEKIIGGMCFYNCRELKALILRNSSVVTLSPVNAFDNSGVKLGTGFVYVHDSKVEEYKAATNWSAIADRIKGVSEIPQDILEVLDNAN